MFKCNEKPSSSVTLGAFLPIHAIDSVIFIHAITMRTLKVLNIVAIVLLFTPFFQMCSDEKKLDHNAVAAKDLVAADSATTSPVPTPHPSASPAPVDDTLWFEEFWELITVPDSNMTMTAFGLFVQAIFQLLDGRPQDIWMGSLFAIISMVLTFAGMIRLLKRKPNGLSRLYLANLLSVLAMFISALLTLDHLYQVRWGFYAYAAVIIALVISSRRTYSRQGDVTTPS
jgi:hypothetical protein